MTTKKAIFSIFCIVLMQQLSAQETTTTTVSAASTDISMNLDLQAVSSVFGESENLEDFEKRLNDPEARISNLDLNQDGNVDYLRVVEVSKDNTHVITLQAIIAKDQYQDVATIDVEKSGEDTQVLVTGDPYIYGPNYFISPYYGIAPPIFGWFWGPYYNPWMSPWFWGSYPPFFRPWRPFPPHIYHNNVHGHINQHNRYSNNRVNRSHKAKHLQKSVSHQDFKKNYPNQSFKNRNSGLTNKHDFNRTSNSFNRSTQSKPFTKPSTNYGSMHRSISRPSGFGGGGFRGGFRR